MFASDHPNAPRARTVLFRARLHAANYAFPPDFPESAFGILPSYFIAGPSILAASFGVKVQRYGGRNAQISPGGNRDLDWLSSVGAGAAADDRSGTRNGSARASRNASENYRSRDQVGCLAALDTTYARRPEEDEGP